MADLSWQAEDTLLYDQLLRELYVIRQLRELLHIYHHLT